MLRSPPTEHLEVAAGGLDVAAGDVDVARNHGQQVVVGMQSARIADVKGARHNSNVLSASTAELTWMVAAASPRLLFLGSETGRQSP